MVYIIKTINGQKVAVPLTADTGSGNPVGTIIAQYKKTNMAGYLYLDGRDTTGTADELETVYPALYAYLGNSNVLPDYREFALVGAEQNTTSSNIATHDTYTQAQEKDDQVQSHQHYIAGAYTSGTNLKCYNGQTNLAGGGGSYGVINTAGTENALAVRNAGGRQGDVTRGKRKAVYFYIKATSGLTENQMDSMLTTLNEQRRYSTTEHKTGRKWLDGKDTYEVTFDCGATTAGVAKDVNLNISNLDKIVNYHGIGKSGNSIFCLPFVNYSAVGYSIQLFIANDIITIRSTNYSLTESYVTVEYTKSS